MADGPLLTPPAPPSSSAPTEQATTTAPASMQVQGAEATSLTAPDVKSAETPSGLPEGTQWRYSEFVSAVEDGKVERVRFSKDGSQLQLTAVDGRRATVVLPNDPELVDTLAKNGVDISVSEGDQQGNYVALLGNILFPLIAFGGLFFLFRRAQGGERESCVRCSGVVWLVHCSQYAYASTRKCAETAKKYFLMQLSSNSPLSAVL